MGSFEAWHCETVEVGALLAATTVACRVGPDKIPCGAKVPKPAGMNLEESLSCGRDGILADVDYTWHNKLRN
jgi:hypothetical protein